MANAKPRNGVPPANEFGQLRAYLAQHKPANMTQPEWNRAIKDHVGTGAEGRTRAEIVIGLLSWMKTW